MPAARRWPALSSRLPRRHGDRPAGPPDRGRRAHRRRYQDVGGYLTPGKPPALSDEAGRFVVDGLLFGDYALDAHAPAYRITTVDELALGSVAPPTPEAPWRPGSGEPASPTGGNDGGTVALRVQMLPIEDTVPLEVVVLDPRGAPEPDATVQIDRSGDDRSPGRRLPPPARPTACSSPPTAATRSRSTGRTFPLVAGF